jgi:hypothetical protein
MNGTRQPASSLVLAGTVPTKSASTESEHGHHPLDKIFRWDFQLFYRNSKTFPLVYLLFKKRKSAWKEMLLVDRRRMIYIRVSCGKVIRDVAVILHAH